MTSRAEPGTQKVSPNHQEDKNSTTNSAISSKFYLKPSLSSKSLSQTRDKEVVLQRIRHHKSINRIKSAFDFEGLCGCSASAQEQKWLQQDDFFFLHLKFKQATSKHSFHIWAIYAYMEIALLLNGFWCYFSIYIFNLYDNSKIGICIITHQADQWSKIHSI
jgi:hypothetical protein